MAEDEILRAKFAQTTADLNKVKAERDSAKDGMNKLINEHQQAMETLRKEQEATLARLEEAHKTTLEQIARETALAQDVMSLKHQQELAQVTEVLSKQKIQTTSAAALESEIATLKTQVQSLHDTVQDQDKQVQELKSEKAKLHKQLEDTNAELSLTTQELKVQREKDTSEDFSSLTPTSPTSPSAASIMTTKTTSSSSSSSSTSSSSQDGSVSKYEFSWSQFVFPMAKKNPSHSHQVNLELVFFVLLFCYSSGPTLTFLRFPLIFSSTAPNDIPVWWLHVGRPWRLCPLAQSRIGFQLKKKCTDFFLFSLTHLVDILLFSSFSFFLWDQRSHENLYLISTLLPSHILSHFCIETKNDSEKHTKGENDFFTRSDHTWQKNN